MAKTGSAVPAWFTTSRCSWSKPGRKTGSDSGGTAPASPVLNQTRLLPFPGSIATTSVDAGNASCSKPTTASRLLWKRHTDAPAGTGSTAISWWSSGADRYLTAVLTGLRPSPTSMPWSASGEQLVEQLGADVAV